MKSFFKITAALAVLAIGQTASAANANIYVTGSTAFRGGAVEAIIALMGGPANCKIAHGGTTQDQAGLDGSNFSTIQGTLTGITGTSTVFCHFTGSTTGIHDVATNTGLTFIPASALPASTGYANAAINQVASGSTVPTVAFSDVFQASSTTPTPALTDRIVAVIPFIWVANRGTTGFSNITAQQARAVLTTGSQSKSLFTGNAANTDLVLEVGRDDGSGTRATMLAETKYGVFTTLKQYKVVTTGTAGVDATVTSVQTWPVDGSSVANVAGNGGYSSGSFIKAIMGATSSNPNFIDEFGTNNGPIGSTVLISCLGASDGGGAITSNGAVKLTYEGADLYNGTAALVATQVYNGLYTMWGYEHVFTNGTPAGDTATFVNGLATQFDNTSILGANGLRYSQMVVNRQSDGAVVGP